MGEARRRARDYTHSMPGRDDRLRSMSRASDFMPSVESKPQAKVESAVDLLHGTDEKHKIKKQRRSIWRQIRIPRPRTMLMIVACLLLLGGAGLLYKKHKDDTAPPRNPFKPSLLASLKFPAYYPSWLPAGYHIDYGSVEEPQANVVIFTMRGPNNAKLYMSEETRPDRYNIGGYLLSLGKPKEIAAAGGTIAVGIGDDNVTVIGNRLYNNTWVLCNTKAPLTYKQITKVLQSLTLAY